MHCMYGMFVWYVCIISACALDAWRGCQVLNGGCGGCPPLLPELPEHGLNDPVVTDVFRVCMFVLYVGYYVCMYCM